MGGFTIAAGGDLSRIMAGRSRFRNPVPGIRIAPGVLSRV